MIKWCYQINDVISKSPFDCFKNHHPTPSAEYAYWNQRFTNLTNIYNQLSDTPITVIARILETIDSVYYPSYRVAHRNTVCALNESRDVRMYLNALARQTEMFETTDFNETHVFVKPMLTCVSLVWAHSKYYTSNEHWTRLFRMLSNLMIHESAKYLDAKSMFQGDPDEGLFRLTDTIDILEYYRYDFRI